MSDCRCYTGVVLRTEGLTGSASLLEMASALGPTGSNCWEQRQSEPQKTNRQRKENPRRDLD